MNVCSGWGRAEIDLGLLASRNVRKHVSVVPAAQSMMLCYSSSGKLKQQVRPEKEVDVSMETEALHQREWADHKGI